MTTNQHETMPLTLRQRRSLVGNLRQDRVANRSQGGRTLSYVEAWDIKATLIKVFGFAGFSAEAEECEIVRIEDNVPKTTGYGKDKKALPIEFEPSGAIKYGTANFRVTARVKVKLTIHQTGAVYSEWAASSQTGPDLGEVTDFAIKTAESDGLKRAAIYLGTQFGLSLYNDGSLGDVVGTVIAPDQEWPPSPRQLAEEQAHIALHSVVPTTDKEAGAKMQAIVHNQPQAAIQPPDSNLSPEEFAKAQELVNRGLKMAKARDQAAPQDQPYADEEEAMQEEMAAQAGPAAVLDRSLDEDGREPEALNQ